jgi:predicted permease
MDTLIQDIRYAIRTLTKNPGFAALVVLTMALGIGANTAVFSLVHAVLLRPLPYPAPEQLVQVEKEWRPAWRSEATLTPFLDVAEVRAWSERNQVFSQMAAYQLDGANLTGGDEAERVNSGRITASFLPMLGIAPICGRGFLPEEDRPGGAAVAILSHALWERRFGSKTNVLGRTITLDQKPYTVVGVLPATFRFPDSYDVCTPFAINRGEFAMPHVIGRLKPGVTLEQARTGLDLIYRAVRRPGEVGRIVLVNLHDQVVSRVKLSLLVYFAAVTFVLLIACANVANLLLARAAQRRKEMAIRVALGAGRLRIMRQLLTESVMLAGLGALLGLLAAFWSKSLLCASIPNLPTLQTIRIDAPVLTFAFLAAVSTGMLFGLAPALEASRPSPNDSLKEAGWATATSSFRQRRLSGFLVISEVTLAIVLLLGAGLLVKSFVRLRGVDSGFRPDRILSLTVWPTKAKYPDAPSRSAFFEQVVNSLRDLPGVEAVGANVTLPMTYIGMSTTGLEIEGHPGAADNDQISVGVVNADYFHALGIPLKKGRCFTEQDRANAPKVAVVNESFVRRYLPNEEALGKRVEGRTLIGIASDVRQSGPANPPLPQIYYSYLQEGAEVMSLAVRTRGDPMKLAPAVRARIQNVDKDQPVHDLMTLDQRLSDILAPGRTNMLLSSLLGGLALGLAALGIYGVLAFSVVQRTHEIGVRVALGAQRRDILKLIVTRGLILTLAGLGTGLIAAVWLTRFLRSLLYEVSALDPWTFVSASIFLLLVALAACYLPARRAARVDPMSALRCE